MAQVSVSQISKHFGGMPAVNDVSIDFKDGEFFGLLGPSGSGKTTLLRIIAGFIRADTGAVRIAGESVESVPVEKRKIGMVFQNYALFPNMSVADNIAFGLRIRKLPREEIAARVSQTLALVQLDGLEARRQHQLSGGQRQRVALARAIITRPRVLLLDEPLSALDKALRMEMQIELKRIQREVGVTTVFVTHDQEEALTMSDRIGILRDGKLVQIGTPKQMYNAPEDEFTARFLGEANILRGEPVAEGLLLEDGSVVGWAKQIGQAKNEAAVDTIAIRPENLILSAQPPVPDEAVNRIRARICERIFVGPTTTCILEWHGQIIKAPAKAEELNELPEQGEIWVCWRREHTIALRSR